MQKWAQKQTGFTIVELLIVIVVIGILAAITIIAFNGVQQKAKIASIQSGLESSAKQLESYKVTNGSETYPTDTTTAGLKPSNGTSYSPYLVNNDVQPAQYCLTSSNDSLFYSISSTHRTPMPGTCVTNLANGPGLDTTADTNIWNINSGVTRNNVTSPTHDGTGAMSLLRTGTGDNFIEYVFTGTPGKTYTVSLWIYMTVNGVTGNSRHLWPYNQSGGTPVIDIPYDTSKLNQWQRLTTTITLVNPQLSIRLYPVSGATPFYVDSLMITESSTGYTYGDGDSSGWYWNGASHASSSTGPATPLN